MATATLLSVGSEILRGETIDTNAAHLGRELSRLGFAVVGVRALPDDLRTIAAAVREARGAADLTLVTGGLGPTHDDLTREAVAAALDEPLSEDQALVARLREQFGPMRQMAVMNLRQALRIPSAEVLRNPIGSAPGWWIDRDGTVLATMPGVPSEMRRMFAEQVLPRLDGRFGARPVTARVVKTHGVGESALAERLAEVLEGGAGYTAGIYARDDGIHVHLATHGEPAAVEAAAARARELAGIDAYGTQDEELAEVVLAAIGARGVTTLASLERQTGGALLAVLAAAAAADGGTRYVGGTLAVDEAATAPAADATLSCRLGAEDAHGRSRVAVGLRGAIEMPLVEVRIHGSGPQRPRRAAFAALDAVRRALLAG